MSLQCCDGSKGQLLALSGPPQPGHLAAPGGRPDPPCWAATFLSSEIMLEVELDGASKMLLVGASGPGDVAEVDHPPE